MHRSAIFAALGAASCYPSGTTIAFQPPLFLGPYTATFKSFTVTTSGVRCLAYATNAAATGSSVTTEAGTVALVGDRANRSFTVICPDGSSYAVPSQDLMSCASGVPSFDEGFGGRQGPRRRFARPPDLHAERYRDSQRNTRLRLR